jgi:hypothetical protein
MGTDNITIKEIFAGQLWEASMVKDILENNGIQAFLQNEYLGNIVPFQVAAGGMNPVKVVVSSLDYDAALLLVNEFNEKNEGIDE